MCTHVCATNVAYPPFRSPPLRSVRFGGSEFSIRSLKFGKSRSFCRISVIFLEISDSGKWSFHTPPPKGPFRTKNTTAIAKIVNYYAVVFLLRPPNSLRRGPFLDRENVCNFQENGVRTRHAAIVNHIAIVNSLRVVNLLRVLFLVRRGPLGSPYPH